VDHGLRPESAGEAAHARTIAEGLGVEFVLHNAHIPPGPNLEARARRARRSLLPGDAMTGHTLDDQAETLLIRLMRGSGTTGLAAMEPGIVHPLLGVRRHETEAVCAELGITPNRDASNDAATWWRNRIRRELMPLLDDIAARDVAPILARTADLLRADDDLLDRLAAELDPTDARSIAAADPVLARRALRRWLAEDGYPPDAAAIDRVLEVAHGRTLACELPGGRRIERSGGRFSFVPAGE